MIGIIIIGISLVFLILFFIMKNKDKPVQAKASQKKEEKLKRKADKKDDPAGGVEGEDAEAPDAEAEGGVESPSDSPDALK